MDKTNLSYDDVCNIIGNLYIQSQLRIKDLESKYQHLLIEHQRTIKDATNKQQEPNNQ